MSKLLLTGLLVLLTGACFTEADPGVVERGLLAECAAGSVMVCHVPPGNPDNAHELCVGAAAVEAHVDRHGDTVGACAPVCSGIEEPCTTIDDCCTGFECLNGYCGSRT